MIYSGKTTLVNTLSDQITCVITSCGRTEYLKKTLRSFLSLADIIPKKFIIIDNSDNGEIFHVADEWNHTEIEFYIIQNETNIGQVASIDKAYSFVKTPYIFHLEDDWEFYDTGFMKKSISVLEAREDVICVNLRNRFSGIRGSMHPLAKTNLETKNGVIYHEYTTGFLGIWHGFSWNPGLRRLSDYKLIGNYKQHGNEESVGKFYYISGFKAACLENCYCEHIGDISTESGRNE